MVSDDGVFWVCTWWGAGTLHSPGVSISASFSSQSWSKTWLSQPWGWIQHFLHIRGWNMLKICSWRRSYDQQLWSCTLNLAQFKEKVDVCFMCKFEGSGKLAQYKWLGCWIFSDQVKCLTHILGAFQELLDCISYLCKNPFQVKEDQPC